MSRDYGKALTKQMLKDWGITQVDYDRENNEWWIDRYWYKNRSKDKKHIRLKVSQAICKHKYTNDKSYPIVCFSYNSKPIALPLARLVYVWYRDDIEAKEVIDHIDNNPFNNMPWNLQKLSVGENLAKRYLDNPNCNKNQFTTETYRKNKELHEFVAKLFNEGKTYEEAQAEVLKYINNKEEN